MIYEDNVKFSDEAKAELQTLGQMVLEASGKALEALEKTIRNWLKKPGHCAVRLNSIRKRFGKSYRTIE